MVQIRESRQAAGPRAPRSHAAAWLAIAVAAVAAAARSGGLDRLLPKDQLFAPYFTT